MDSTDDSADSGSVFEHRRRFLQALGATGLAGAAGCAGLTGDDEPDDSDDSDDSDDGEAVFEVSGLEPSDVEVEADATLTVSATITNTGDAEGTQDVTYRIGEETLATQSLTLAAATEESVEFDVTLDDREDGEYTHGVYTDDADQTATLTVVAGPELPAEPDALLSLDETTVIRGENALTGTVANPYEFALEDVEVGLAGPAGWELTADGDTSFDTLDADASQDVAWALTVPDDAADEADLEATVTYAAEEQTADVTATYAVTVVDAASIPYGLNAGGVYDPDADAIVAEPVEIDGVEFESYTEDVAPDPAVTLVGTHNESGSNMLGNEIEGTDADAIYQTMMWGDGSMGYEIMVPSGYYDVTLHIAEVHFGVEGGQPDPDADLQRTFSAFVQGEPVFEELETWNAPLEAMPQTIEGVEVAGGPLVIELEGDVENPMVNALEIRDAGGPPTLEPGTAIELNGQTSGWVGRAPDDLADETNPALTLQEGETYEIGWTTGDGGTHNIAIRDENGDVVDDLVTEVTSDPGDEQWLEFEASAEMVEYVCQPHQGIMNGTITVV